MVIEVVVTLTRWPGVHLGGEIESGVVQVGDHLDLVDSGKLIRKVTCDGIGSLDRVGGTQRCLVTVYCAAVSPEEVREGQVLTGTQLRRPEDAVLPRSVSAPVYQRETAAATAFANRYASQLMSQASEPQLPEVGGHGARHRDEPLQSFPAMPCRRVWVISGPGVN